MDRTNIAGHAFVILLLVHNIIEHCPLNFLWRITNFPQKDNVFNLTLHEKNIVSEHNMVNVVEAKYFVVYSNIGKG